MTRNPSLLALALCVALAACDPGSPGGRITDPVPDPLADRVGPGVLEAIGREGGVQVMVALRSTELAGHHLALAEGVTVPDAREPVDRLLERMAGQSIALTRRFVTVPALAARVGSAEALSALAADPAVHRVDLDVGGGGALGASVARIGADLRHARGNGGEGVVVAVLDTGVETVNPALAGRIVGEACFGARGSGPPFCHNGQTRHTGPGAARDDAGHGTHVAGIVASSGSVGAPGVAPGARIVAVKVMDNCDFAGCFYAFSEIVAALDHLIVNQGTLGVRVVNMSLGTGALFSGVCDQATAYNMAGSQAVNTLWQMGVVVFAASMNDHSSTHMASPACLARVVSVGAVDAQDAVASFSNSNAATDLLAPGVSIRSLALGGSTRVVSGTSMAAPHAAGCAALLVHASPEITPEDLVARLRRSAVQVTDPRNRVTFPRIDCAPGGHSPDPRRHAPVERP